MAKRYVETSRWNDSFFIELSPYAKITLCLLYDRSNEAGIFDAHIPSMEVQLKMNKESIKNALIELKPLLLSDGKNKLFIKEFLRHQMKLPLRRGSVENDWIISKLQSNLQRFNNAPEILEILNNIEDEKKVEPVKKIVKVKKEPNELIIPSIEEFSDFFVENGYRKDIGENTWRGYNDAKWHDSKGNKVFNWKQKVRHNWFKPYNEIGYNKEVSKSKTNVSFSVSEELTRKA